MNGRQRVLDPSLAELVSKTDGESRFASRIANSRGRRRQTRSRPVSRLSQRLLRARKLTSKKGNFEKEEPNDKLKVDLEQIESTIAALKNSKDPYVFEATIKQIQEELDFKKKQFKLPENQEKLSSEVLSLQQDETTINARLTELTDEREKVNCEVQSKKDLIQALTGQLNQTKMDLRSLQNRSDAITGFVADSTSEQKMIQHNLQVKRVQLAEMEEQMSSRSKSLKLISATENTLQNASTQFLEVQKQFLTKWQNWNVEQMVSWICEQDPAYEQYRMALRQKLPEQAESGADFAYFDTNILLGLGIGKIRHRGELMKSIAQLVN